MAEEAVCLDKLGTILPKPSYFIPLGLLKRGSECVCGL